ncbi:bifunctional YbaK-aminoacyl-tRNA synthetase-associated domain/Prolyl-tRNA synthetase [Babesia duncani]|uniref:proline--tRNA ligase n=1 Tax=Babesia duncani TaxID=323732 RepID=A0AAD9PLV1_9APIC|nr:bifunctional YbaK-aminoacyl-tRNA synthetase-associated domain/Prolyl-tRNA synthetase [Babesia duncani]
MLKVNMKADELIKLLRNLGLHFTEYKHAAAVAVQDLHNIPELAPKMDSVVKNLWLVDGMKRHYILTALHDTRVEFKNIRRALKVKSIGLGDEKLMMEMVDAARGHLSPLSIFNDTEGKVKLLLDERLKEKKTILSHPLHNAATIEMPLEDYFVFFRHLNHEPEYINFDPLPPSEPTPPKSKEKEGHILGVTVKKAENFTEWYTQVIVRSQLIEYYDISGCYIYLPASYCIWEYFQKWFNGQLANRKVDNCYFPMFVSKAKLEKEKDHIEGFSPEVAWVTKSGDSDFVEPIAIRPTSETIMYPEYAKWIKSYRDLPLKLNQWNSVVRWEFKQPTPFIRSREFLWQEGHTAHLNEEEALDMVYDILDLYREFYEDHLAVPMIKGVKSESEKFAGGKITTTVETFIGASGRGIQAATSHLLGTNFAKMFEIEYEAANGTKQLVHQTSWGFTTRSIGIMIMVHGDDRGLVMPPKVAKIQVVIVPILNRKCDVSDDVVRVTRDIYQQLESAGIRVKLDDRQGCTPGFKYNHWELRGIPLRIEVGPRDVGDKICQIVARHSGEKIQVPLEDLKETIPKLLERVQTEMFANAKKQLDDSIVTGLTFDDVMPALRNNKCLLLPWCEDPSTEVEVKAETQRQSLEDSGIDSKTGGMKCFCIPLEQPPMPPGTKCFWTDKPAKRWSLWGRSY